MTQTVRSTVLLVLAWCLLQPAVYAQDTDFDASWYNPATTYVKVAVVQDGVYQITGADLAALGLSVATIAPGNLRLLKNGQEVPLWYEGEQNGDHGVDVVVERPVVVHPHPVQLECFEHSTESGADLSSRRKLRVTVGQIAFHLSES